METDQARTSSARADIIVVDDPYSGLPKALSETTAPRGLRDRSCLFAASWP